MPELIPFHCKSHGWRLDTIPSADVWCACGNRCWPPEEHKPARERALNAKRMQAERRAKSAQAPATSLVPARGNRG